MNTATRLSPTATATLDVVVRQRQLQGQTVAVLTLEATDGAALPAFSAGAHVDVHLPGGLIRPYSLCGDPADTRAYRLGILKEPSSRGGSVAVHASLQEGSRLSISPPRNHFPLDETATHSMLIGGGIGITPMLAMAWRLHALGASFALHYCARHQAGAAFLDELAQAPWADRVTLHFDAADASTQLQPAEIARRAPAGSHLYVCGPAGFMDWVMTEATAAGLEPAQIHREYFTPPLETTSTADADFEVEARRSGKTVRVLRGETLRTALQRIGISVPVSCEQGVCGTCACTVLAGEPDHRDAYLTDEERAANDQIMACCSRARSARLVLDL
jgi:ferredoxin-NADP reductase